MTSAFLEADVRAAAAGDPGAFARLVQASQSTVCSISLAIVRNVAESEDVAQEAYLEAWKGLGRLKNPASFLPWLRQLTRHRARNSLRGGIRHRRRARPLEDEVLASAADPAPDAAETLERRQQAELVARVLDELPDDAREVIALYYREGRSTRQVSLLLGLSEAAVRQRLARARKALREEVLERAGEGLRRTMPGAAFGAAVTGAVAASAPAASVLALSASAKAGGSLLAKATAFLGAVLLPAGVAIGASELDYRRITAGGIGEEEARGFRRLRVVTAAGIVLACLLLNLSFSLTGRWWAPVLVFAGLMALLGYNTFFWIPRLTARRLDEARRRDPTAARRQRRDRWLCIFGYLAGLLCGSLGLAFGLLSAVSGG